MQVVGVTGGIGSGKTTVCRIFELLGVPVFYADDEAKKLYDDPKIKRKVIKIFSKKVIEKNGEVDKKKLAEIVFSDKGLLTRLNAIIHPEVLRKFNTWKAGHKGKKYVIKEAAVMIESGTYKSVNYLISVNSYKKLIIKRLLLRNNTNIEAIHKRINAQISDRERAKYADAVILNDEKHSLIRQVMKIHQIIVKS